MASVEEQDMQFLQSLSEDPVVALNAICKRFREFDRPIPRNDWYQHRSGYLRHFALALAYLEASGLSFDVPMISTVEPSELAQVVKSFFGTLLVDTEQKIAGALVQNYKTKFAQQLGRGFLYEFSDGDLKRVQQLINELRSEIAASKLFEEDHRARLLARLERVQAEIHKKVSDLDRMWGLVGDAGVVLGKFGKDAKPFFDRIREIADIVWRTQARAEELPSNAEAPLLTNKDPSAS